MDGGGCRIGILGWKQTTLRLGWAKGRVSARDNIQHALGGIFDDQTLHPTAHVGCNNWLGEKTRGKTFLDDKGRLSSEKNETQTTIWGDATTQ